LELFIWRYPDHTLYYNIGYNNSDERKEREMLNNFKDRQEVVNHMRDIMNIDSISNQKELVETQKGTMLVDAVDVKLRELSDKLVLAGWDKKVVKEMEAEACAWTRFSSEIPSMSAWD